MPLKSYQRRDKSNGQLRMQNGVHIHSKGYLRIMSGALRNQYVHRIVAAAMLGRELDKSEQVHHRDADKTNAHWRNLFVMGEKDHSWVSARQAWFMQNKDEKEKAEWDKFMDERAEEFYQEVADAKTDGVPWECMDGRLKREWERRQQSSAV